LIDLISDRSRFLAVNTQANAGNRGYNTITKYPNADYACIAEHEVRLEMRDRSGSIKPMMQRIMDTLSLKHFVVTTGKKGCTVLCPDHSFIEVPAFAQKTVDRLGAGDAFFSITALCAFLNCPGEVIAFLGNAAGSMAANIVGNKKPVEKDAMRKYVMALMK
jgi:bifunctional ADP-heptose synthase (sugar kinase/adenylyltransferase)